MTADPTHQELKAIQLRWRALNPESAGGPSPEESAQLLQEIRARQIGAEAHALKMLTAATANPRSFGGHWSRWGKLWAVMILGLVIVLAALNGWVGR